MRFFYLFIALLLCAPASLAILCKGEAPTPLAICMPPGYWFVGGNMVNEDSHVLESSIVSSGPLSMFGWTMKGKITSRATDIGIQRVGAIGVALTLDNPIITEVTANQTAIIKASGLLAWSPSGFRPTIMVRNIRGLKADSHAHLVIACYNQSLGYEPHVVFADRDIVYTKLMTSYTNERVSRHFCGEPNYSYFGYTIVRAPVEHKEDYAWSYYVLIVLFALGLTIVLFLGAVILAYFIYRTKSRDSYQKV
jgi:hypothetical protein